MEEDGEQREDDKHLFGNKCMKDSPLCNLEQNKKMGYHRSHTLVIRDRKRKLANDDRHEQTTNRRKRIGDKKKNSVRGVEKSHDESHTAAPVGMPRQL